MENSKSFSLKEALTSKAITIDEGTIVSEGVRFILTEDNGISDGVIQIGKNSIIREGAIICSGVSIGDNVKIGHNSVIRNKVSIGNNVTISHMVCIEQYSTIGNNVRISTLTHMTGKCIVEDDVQIGARVVTVNDNKLVWGKNPDLQAPIFRKNCRVGSGVTVLGGCEIGENTIIGAGALVTKNIPPNVLAYGVPAYVQKDLV
jgi:acetyltransferase-like isoleucine patch superfamily enzyme